MACSAGEDATSRPISKATSTEAAKQPSHHQRTRYTAAGKEKVTNRPTVCQADGCAPDAAPRASGAEGGLGYSGMRRTILPSC